MSAKLYPGIAFSPQASLTNNIGAADTIIEVSDVSAFPPAPNLATIGTDEEGETILYAAKTETGLSGCQRGVEGAARAWTAGELIGRNWTAKDHADLIAAILEDQKEIAAAQGAAETAQADAQKAASAATDAQASADAKQSKLTGLPGQVVGFDAAGNAAAAPGWSNENLLRNWDFRNPVNRNGKAEYANQMAIDGFNLARCTALLQNDGIVLKFIPTDGYNAGVFYCHTEREKLIPGQTYTYSALVENSILSVTFTADSAPESIDWLVPANYSEGDTCVSIHTAPTYFQFDIYTKNTTGVLAKAAKVEPGDRQTLARQNEDGEWEIIDPPDYDLQYLLCSQYSPSTSEWVGSQHSNPNLLDNWYFADPINQRGATEYSGAAYGIDRWRGSGSHVRCVLEPDGLTVGRIPGNTITSTKNAVQFIENWQQLAGRTITISALVSRATNTALIYLFNATMTTALGNAPGTYNGKPLLITKTVTLPENIDGLQFQLRAQSGDDGSSATFLAAKLELGPIQTLTHKEGDTWVLNDPPPNKALELTKCQRYYRIYATQEARPDKALDCSPVMRTNPAQTTIVINGVTYYVNDANL